MDVVRNNDVWYRADILVADEDKATTIGSVNYIEKQ